MLMKLTKGNWIDWIMLGLLNIMMNKEPPSHWIKLGSFSFVKFCWIVKGRID